LDRLRPNPETLSTSINSGTHLKTTVLLQQDTIEDVAFARAILSDDSNNCEVAAFGIDAGKQINSLLVYPKH
jgi:hypothetical protein